MLEVLEAQCSTLEQNWGRTTISLLKDFLLYLLEKAFDLNLIKTGAAAYLSLAQCLDSGTMYGTWQCYCIKERRTLAFYKTVSPISVTAVYILSSKEKVHVNSLASLKQLCVSSFLKKSWRTPFSMFYRLACNLLGNCRKWTNKWSSRVTWLNLRMFFPLSLQTLVLTSRLSPLRLFRHPKPSMYFLPISSKLAISYKYCEVIQTHFMRTCIKLHSLCRVWIQHKLTHVRTVMKSLALLPTPCSSFLPRWHEQNQFSWIFCQPSWLHGHRDARMAQSRQEAGPRARRAKGNLYLQQCLEWIILNLHMQISHFPLSRRDFKHF